VRIDATLFFTIADPAAYLLAEDHVRPALRRVYLSRIVDLAASRRLDDFLAARPDEDLAKGGNGAELAMRRQALRSDLAASINRRLQVLRAQGLDLGVAVGRVDLVAVLPQIAKVAFDAVLTATQIADQQAAAARTDAARIRQEADRERDRLLSDATAAAEERVRNAAADTSRTDALASQETPDNRDALMAHAYQEQIAAILQRAGDVTAIDVTDGQQLVLPGPVR
jgi:regulator of protease activity HflC (stomatin/prohibitin superfamily)